jgi:hypothetical protein
MPTRLPTSGSSPGPVRALWSRLRPKQLWSTSWRTRAVLPAPGEPEIRAPGLEPSMRPRNSWRSQCRPMKRGSVSSSGTSKNSGFSCSWACCWASRTRPEDAMLSEPASLSLSLTLFTNGGEIVWPQVRAGEAKAPSKNAAGAWPVGGGG